MLHELVACVHVHVIVIFLALFLPCGSGCTVSASVVMTHLVPLTAVLRKKSKIESGAMFSAMISPLRLLRDWLSPGSPGNMWAPLGVNTVSVEKT